MLRDKPEGEGEESFEFRVSSSGKEEESITESTEDAENTERAVGG